MRVVKRFQDSKKKPALIHNLSSMMMDSFISDGFIDFDPNDVSPQNELSRGKTEIENNKG